MSDKVLLLHKDIWFDILLRLPIKTLVICACTCKTLNSYIISPDFIAAHLNKSKHNPLIFLRCHQETGEYRGKQLYGLHPDDHDDDESLNWDFNIRKLPLKTHAPYLRIVGSCNGVFCLSDDLEGYLNVTYLWNPSINKYIQLPYPNINFSEYGPYDMYLGFGLDEVANDFKVVRIVYLDGCDYYTELPLVEVYSVKSGSWRNVDNFGPNIPKQYLFISGYSQCYLNGAIHWLGNPRNPKYVAHIVTFNVVDECFGVMKLPASFDKSSPVTITTCRDKLALVHLRPQESFCRSEGYEDSRIWVMKEYGVVDSWTPVFALTDPEMVPLFKMVTFRKNEDLIMLVDNGTVRDPCHVIQSVNANTGVVKELSKHRGSIRGFYLGLYEETLALFNEGKPTSDNVIEDNVDNDVEEDDESSGRVEDILRDIAATMFRTRVKRANQKLCIEKGND